MLKTVKLVPVEQFQTARSAQLATSSSLPLTFARSHVLMATTKTLQLGLVLSAQLVVSLAPTLDLQAAHLVFLATSVLDRISALLVILSAMAALDQAISFAYHVLRVNTQSKELQPPVLLTVVTMQLTSTLMTLCAGNATRSVELAQEQEVIIVLPVHQLSVQ